MARTRLLVATRNKGKLREFQHLLADAPFDLVSLGDVGVADEVAETGGTFEENAILKAEGYARLSGLPTLADDSGLEVGALGDAPGVHSARFAGEYASDAQNIALLLEKLKGVPGDRLSARFRCVIAVAWPGLPTKTFTGECPGRIVRTPRGGNGFGYDPVFFIPRLGKTIAELPPDEKHRISHRGKAARKAVQWLRTMADEEQLRTAHPSTGSG
ncbi:MAG: XTP/dITP diphosphatase [SAR202 cluster bacterium]|nr:XTP/dITP diphosphatase [SAR202 cluster bacterium]